MFKVCKINDEFMNKKIKIEVWTDIMCPYCYIGKIHYERALNQFEHADDVELQIKAFQLNPNLPDKGNGYPVVDYLLNTAGLPENKMRQMFDYIENLADKAGVKFNLPHAIAANTRDAHRLIKLAAKSNLDMQVMTLISKGYFEDAKDYSDIDFLIATALEAGLNEEEVRQMLAGNDYHKEVDDDIAEARELGLDTVPTFLFERKRAIIGAEPVDVFLHNLKATHTDWALLQTDSAEMKVSKGKSCQTDGFCEI